MAAASARGVALGLVTATSEGNVAALLTALGLGRAGFATVVHRERIGRPKPEPDAYLRALDDLALDAGAAIAVEDNPDGAIAACSAGVTCVALPGALHAGSAFPAGVERQATLDLASRLAA
jgi:HAD superfamily hydrolase (TIGR01509 family)